MNYELKLLFVIFLYFFYFSCACAQETFIPLLWRGKGRSKPHEQEQSHSPPLEGQGEV